VKQPKWASWIEAIGGTAFGFVIAIPTQYFVNWAWGLQVSHSGTFGIVGFFTVVSVFRGYIWRRLCVNLGLKRTLSPFMQAVIAERFRQIEGEGWSTEHDDQHEAGELAKAGATYASRAHWHQADNYSPAIHAPPDLWPWAREWWKPYGFRRDLVRACALIVAEGEKFDRQRKRPATVEG
jgi:hypothetical protein